MVPARCAVPRRRPSVPCAALAPWSYAVRPGREAAVDEVARYVAPYLEPGTPDRHPETLGVDLQPRYRCFQHVITEALERLARVGGGVRPGNTAVQQDGRPDRPVPHRLDLVELFAHGAGAVYLDGGRRTRDQDLVRVPQRGPGDARMILQLRCVDDHHVIGPGDLGQPAVQFPGRQRDDPEREGRLRRLPEIAGADDVVIIDAPQLEDHAGIARSALRYA